MPAGEGGYNGGHDTITNVYYDAEFGYVVDTVADPLGNTVSYFVIATANVKDANNHTWYHDNGAYA
jgi:hypothetical protein